MVERVTRKNENRESELPLTISAQYGLIDQNEFFDKRIASRDVSGYYLLKKGEFAYNKSTSSDAPWGAVKRLDRYEMGVLSTLYIVFALKENGNIDSDFLFRIMIPTVGIREFKLLLPRVQEIMDYSISLLPITLKQSLQYRPT